MEQIRERMVPQYQTLGGLTILNIWRRERNTKHFGVRAAHSIKHLGVGKGPPDTKQSGGGGGAGGGYCTVAK